MADAFTLMSKDGKRLVRAIRVGDRWQVVLEREVIETFTFEAETQKHALQIAKALTQ